MHILNKSLFFFPSLFCVARLMTALSQPRQFFFIYFILFFNSKYSSFAATLTLSLQAELMHYGKKISLN